MHNRSVPRFDLRRYFSLASLVVVVITTIVVGLLSYARARDALLQSSQELAANLAENLSYQLANAPELRATTGSGKIFAQNPEMVQRLAVALPPHIHGLQIDKFKVYDPAATIIFSTEADDVGRTEQNNVGIQTARRGQNYSQYGSIAQDQIRQILPGTFIETYVPIYAQGSANTTQDIIGFVEIYRDVSALEAELTRSASVGALTVGAAMLLLYVALLWIVRRADSILTQQRQALEDQNQQLQELQKYRDDLTNMFVHDLRNPMTSIMGNLGLLQEERSGLDQDQRAMLNASVASSQEVMRLLNDLLSINSIEHGTLALRSEPFGVLAWLNERAARWEGASQQQQVKISVQVAPPDLSACGDRQLLTRVVDNLIANALHYTDANGAIRLCAESDNGQIKIMVQDTGMGISPEDTARIFEKFFRASDTGTHKHGLGLGLAFCKLAVQAHHGRIWVESQKGVGSTLAFTLPAN